jgi:DNA-binding CsgD family transcriptional regulator
VTPRPARLPTDVLPPEAATLYEQLLSRGGMALGGSGLDPDDPRVRVLLDRGFAARPHQRSDWLAPLAPVATLEAWLIEQEAELRRRHVAISKAFGQLDELQRLFIRGQPLAPGEDLVTVVTDADELRVASVSMRRAAREQLRVFDTASHQKPREISTLSLPDEAERARGLVVRSVYRTDYLDSSIGREIMTRSANSGEQVRVRDRLPMKMLVADRHTALVALVPTGVEGALLVRAPILIDALCDYFELVWREAVPWPTGEPNGADGTLSALQRRILGLMAAGVKDDAIARQCGLSVRTLRRHVSAIMTVLGVSTRFAAGIEAARRDLV